MAAEPESEEIRRMLAATSIAVDDGPDVGAIRSGIRRRRRVRRGLAGFAAVAVLGIGTAVAARPSDDATPVEVLDDPSTTVPEAPEPDGAVDLSSIGPIAPEGIAVQTEAGVELRGLDGGLLHTLAGYSLATEERLDGLPSTVTNVLPLEADDGSLHWFDPASGLATTVDAQGGTPLWNGAQVAFDPDRGLRVVEAGRERDWMQADEWRLSSDHRVATVVGTGQFDSATATERQRLQGCWIAAQRDAHDVHICDAEDVHSVAHLVDGTGAAAVLPLGTDGEPRRATAAWLAGEEVLVRAESLSCFVADAMVLRGDVLEPLLGPVASANPSSAPIGVSADGRAIVHLNAAACDAASADMGVYLIDLTTGEGELVWAGAAQLGEVRAWTTLPLAAADPPTPPTSDAGLEDLERVTPEEIGRDVIVFGDAGIVRIVDGERQPIWNEPVDRAFGDFAGGVVFQDQTVLTQRPDGPIDVERGAIRHLPWGESTPLEIVSSRDLPTLWMVGTTGGIELGEPLHGRSGYVWFTRTDNGGETSAEVTSTLFSVWTETGNEREIGEAGGTESGLDGIARLGDGRTLFSTCHIQCAIRPGLNDPDPIVLPHWLGGLDGTATTWGYVKFDPTSDMSGVTNPVLTIHGLDDQVRARVALPAAIGWETFVDLSDDGTAALVGSRDWWSGDVSGPVYVDGLDTDTPRVRVVESGGQQVRSVN